MQTFFDGITKKPSYELPIEAFVIRKKQNDYIIYNKDSGGWIICNKEELAVIYFQAGLKKDFADFLYESNMLMINGNYFYPPASYTEYDKHNIDNDYCLSDIVSFVYIKDDNFNEAIKNSNSLKDNKLSILINCNRKLFLSNPEFDKEIKYFDDCMNFMLCEDELLTDIDILEVILNVYQCKQLNSIIALVKKEKCANQYNENDSIAKECCSSCEECINKAFCRYKIKSDQGELRCSHKYLYEKIFEMVLNNDCMNRKCKELIENLKNEGK